MSAIKADIDTNSGLGLQRIKLLEKIEKFTLSSATEEDLARVEKMFIKAKIGIEYFPAQKKKTVRIRGERKVVPIEYLYGSENVQAII